MREFTDEGGAAWMGTVQEEGGTDYKGRFFLVLEPVGEGDPVSLRDVRWNSARTARRTLETMSEVELRRRLRVARGRN